MNINNEKKITAELAKCQSRSRSRNINYQDILTEIKKIEKYLSQYSPKKYWVDTKVNVDPEAQKFSGRYKGTPESTQFTLIRKKSSWDISKIERYQCGTKKYQFIFTTEMISNIIHTVANYENF